MTSRTRQEASLDKRAAVDTAESAGQVADSMSVRGALMAQFNRGEKTLAQVQAELAAIKRAAKKSGLLTRTQVWNRA